MTDKKSLNIGQRLFAPENRPHIHRVFLTALFLSLFFGLGLLLALVLRPAAQKTALSSPTSRLKPSTYYEQKMRKELESIKDIDLFNITLKDGKKRPTSPLPLKGEKTQSLCTSATLKSQLPITLHNTVVLQDSVKSLASVQALSKKDLLNIREGESIEGLAQLGRITRRKVIFRNAKSKECEFVENIDKAGKGKARIFDILSPEKGQKLIKEGRDRRIRQSGNKFTIKKSLREEMLKDLGSLLTQAKATQIRNPDGSYSFKISDIVAGSIYTQLNIEDGDIIQKINGRPIRNMNKVMSLFGKLDTLEKLRLTIKKRGKSQEFKYQFE